MRRFLLFAMVTIGCAWASASGYVLSKDCNMPRGGDELAFSLRAMKGNVTSNTKMVNYMVGNKHRDISLEEAATIGIFPIPARINDYNNIRIAPYYINENMLRLEHGLDMRVSHNGIR